MNDRLTAMLNEKWMAVVAWLGLLGALLFSSYQPIGLIRGSGVGQLVMAMFSTPGLLAQNRGLILPFVGLALLVITLVLLLFIWLRFAQLTNDVMIAMASGPDDDEPVFLSFLDLVSAPGAQSEGTSELEARGSTFGEIVRLLALFWVLGLLAAAMISLGGLA